MSVFAALAQAVLCRPPVSTPAPSPAVSEDRPGFPSPRSLVSSRHPVLLTLDTRDRRCRFEPGPVARDIFDLCILNHHTVAACLLPDRLSWLLTTGQGVAGEVRRFRDLADRIGREHALPDAHRGLWRTSYRAESLPTTAQVVATCKAILSAPVACGLVRRVEDWPYQLWRL